MSIYICMYYVYYTCIGIFIVRIYSTHGLMLHTYNSTWYYYIINTYPVI